jgi:hypothetical protein
MQRRLFTSLLGVAMLLALPRVAFSAGDDLSGFTLQQLDRAMKQGGLGKQKIYSILTFSGDERRGDNLAILSSTLHTGWRLTVLHRVVGGLKVIWRSGRLPDDIAVSSSNNLTIGNLDDGEEVVEFSGCAAHDCGGLSGRLGWIIYSPRSKQVFYAHYRSDDSKPSGTFGFLDLSENASSIGSERYKALLQKEIKKTLGQ